MRKLLHMVNLGDAYEFNARILPAMLVVLPVTTLVLGMEFEAGHWARAIGLGAGLEGVLAVLFSKLAHALGQAAERKLKQRWGGFPTTRWLLPDDPARSTQQKVIWINALSKLSDLDLKSVMGSADSTESSRLLDDAILTVRNRIRHDKRAALLRQQNIYYGFARNLHGLRWVAVGVSVLALAAASAMAWRQTAPVPLVYVEALFAILACCFLPFTERYVLHTAERYAEFFLTVAASIAKASRSKAT